jgi:RNA polymerase sigma-70 factor (ECF subfamily)
MQETLLKMIKSLHNLKKRESLWPWLFNVASNVINDHFRKHRYSKVVLFSTLKNDTWEENLQYDYNKFGDDPARRELSAMVGESISKLETGMRNVVRMRCFCNMSYRQISTSVGFSTGAARALFFRAKRRIKGDLQNRISVSHEPELQNRSLPTGFPV